MPTTQRYEYHCPFCHNVIGGTHNIAPQPPCPCCDVWWGEGDLHVVQVGPPGTHAPVGLTVGESVERLMEMLRKIFVSMEGEEEA